MNGVLSFEKTYNHLFYRSTRKLTRDTEIIFPVSYSIKVPKKIRYCEVGFLGKSLFDYGDSQFVIIVQNDEPSLSESNNLTEEDWQKLVMGKFESTRLHRMKLDAFQLLNGRSSMILKKDSISIVLYNIKKSHFKTFVDHVRTLQINHVYK
jgi:hypothetical protein